MEFLILLSHNQTDVQLIQDPKTSKNTHSPPNHFSQKNPYKHLGNAFVGILCSFLFFAYENIYEVFHMIVWDISKKSRKYLLVYYFLGFSFNSLNNFSKYSGLCGTYFSLNSGLFISCSNCSMGINLSSSTSSSCILRSSTLQSYFNKNTLFSS